MRVGSLVLAFLAAASAVNADAGTPGRKAAAPALKLRGGGGTSQENLDLAGALYVGGIGALFGKTLLATPGVAILGAQGARKRPAPGTVQPSTGRRSGGRRGGAWRNPAPPRGKPRADQTRGGPPDRGRGPPGGRAGEEKIVMVF